jgi:HTH-type transcriptional regulator/antitoxin HigA
MDNFVALEPYAPGELIAEELDARGWSQKDLATILGIQSSVVSALIKGKKRINTDLAQRLAAAFGNNAQFWVNLEGAYRLALENQGAGDIEEMSSIYTVAPVGEMLKRGWIREWGSIGDLRDQILRFYNARELSEIATAVIPHAARKSTYEVRPTAAQKAWLQRVRNVARGVSAARYADQNLASVIRHLRDLLSEPEQVRHVPRLLAGSGIRFVVVEPLPHTRIDGACLWLDSSSPVIALSLRFERLDNFWFTLFHELGHVSARDGLQFEVIDTDLIGEKAIKTSDKPEYEQRADRFAVETLVPQAELENFIARVRPLFSKVKIQGFAARMGVHPAIVVGQLQHRGVIPWAHSREFLVKVRDTVIEAGLTDGWGQILPNIA